MPLISPSSSNSKMWFKAPVLLVLLLAVATNMARAAKDTDYYYPGFINPNTDNKMYWKDSVNVLQDLDQFESLYITYHHCVWSKYGSHYGTGEDYDEDDDEDEEDDNGCGGWGGEYYWYMGRTQCFKANVAYTLYGVLKGDDPKMRGGSFCHKDTYINSFFTTFGAESFAGPMGLGVDSANSYCISSNAQNYNGNGQQQNGGSQDNQGDYEDAQADDDYVGDDYVYREYDSYVSSGTGCSAEGDFVLDTYNGAFCHGANYNSTYDYLESYNAALRGFDCTQIYSASGGNNNNNNDQDRRRRTNEEDMDFENMNMVSILSYSKTCSLSQYPKDCPDPYGKKRQFAKNIQRALAYKTGENRDIATRAMAAGAWICFLSSLIVLAAAYFLYQETQADTRRQSRRRRRREKNGPEAGNVAANVIHTTFSTDTGGSSKYSTGSGGSRSTARSKSPKRFGGMRMPKMFRFPRRKAAISTDDICGCPNDAAEMSLGDYELSKRSHSTSTASVSPNNSPENSPSRNVAASETSSPPRDRITVTDTSPPRSTTARTPPRTETLDITLPKNDASPPKNDTTTVPITEASNLAPPADKTGVGWWLTGENITMDDSAESVEAPIKQLAHPDVPTRDVPPPPPPPAAAATTSPDTDKKSKKHMWHNPLSFRSLSPRSPKNIVSPPSPTLTEDEERKLQMPVPVKTAAAGVAAAVAAAAVAAATADNVSEQSTETGLKPNETIRVPWISSSVSVKSKLDQPEAVIHPVIAHDIAATTDEAPKEVFSDEAECLSPRTRERRFLKFGFPKSLRKPPLSPVATDGNNGEEQPELKKKRSLFSRVKLGHSGAAQQHLQQEQQLASAEEAGAPSIPTDEAGSLKEEEVHAPEEEHDLTSMIKVLPALMQKGGPRSARGNGSIKSDRSQKVQKTEAKQMVDEHGFPVTGKAVAAVAASVAAAKQAANALANSAVDNDGFPIVVKHSGGASTGVRPAGAPDSPKPRKKTPASVTKFVLKKNRTNPGEFELKEL